MVPQSSQTYSSGMLIGSRCTTFFNFMPLLLPQSMQSRSACGPVPGPTIPMRLEGRPVLMRYIRQSVDRDGREHCVTIESLRALICSARTDEVEG